MRCGVDEDTFPGELDDKQIVSLHQLLHEAKFKDPDKDHLSPAGGLHPFPCLHPHSTLSSAGFLKATRVKKMLACCAGEYNLRLGILKELNPELVATHQGTRQKQPVYAQLGNPLP